MGAVLAPGEAAFCLGEGSDHRRASAMLVCSWADLHWYDMVCVSVAFMLF